MFFEDVNVCARPYLTLAHKGRREFGSRAYLQASARSTYTGRVFAFFAAEVVVEAEPLGFAGACNTTVLVAGAINKPGSKLRHGVGPIV